MGRRRPYSSRSGPARIALFESGRALRALRARGAADGGGEAAPDVARGGARGGLGGEGGDGAEVDDVVERRAQAVGREGLCEQGAQGGEAGVLGGGEAGLGEDQEARAALLGPEAAHEARRL